MPFVLPSSHIWADNSSLIARYMGSKPSSRGPRLNQFQSSALGSGLGASEVDRDERPDNNLNWSVLQNVALYTSGRQAGRQQQTEINGDQNRISSSHGDNKVHKTSNYCSTQANIKEHKLFKNIPLSNPLVAHCITFQQFI